MSEILAPAGDMQSALTAINCGADAVYLGLKEFSARSSAQNFDFDELEKLLKYAHAFGIKVYVAMNTLVKISELEDFLKTVVAAWNLGVDAFIISDVFLGGYLKKAKPQIKIHLSTQAGVCNKYVALLAKDYGFDRVVLSRETPLSDIAEISSIIETEVFIQGALCTCFSGQCYFSSFAGGNSGNRGKCKQPCRKRYSIDRSGFENMAYRLSLADLSVGTDIQKFISAGVTSFKIEGRMRRAEYVAAAVNFYRGIIDGNGKESDFCDLKRTFNRGNYTKGLAFGQDKSFISSAVQGHIGEYAGVIKVENGKYVCQTRAQFSAGDCFKILRDGVEVGGATYGGTVKSGVVLNSSARLKGGDKAFITTDCGLNERLLSKQRLIKVRIDAEFLRGERAKICVNGCEFFGDEPLQSANNRPLSVEDIEKCFKKVDRYPFEVTFGNVSTDGVFIGISALNALRRDVFDKFFDKISQRKNEQADNLFTIPKLTRSNGKITAVICENLNNVQADVGILKIFNAEVDVKKLFNSFKGKKYLYLPPFLTGEEIEKFKPLAAKFDGIYCDGIYGVKLSEEWNLPLFAGTGFNLSNSAALSQCKAEYVALSKELTITECAPLISENTVYLCGGGIKLMDLVYCPFEKKCAACDKRGLYTLTDESGRKFQLRRYETSGCRFEIYNCAKLVAESGNAGILLDLTLENEKDCDKIVKNCKDIDKLKECFGDNYTRGHSVQPVK